MGGVTSSFFLPALAIAIIVIVSDRAGFVREFRCEVAVIGPLWFGLCIVFFRQCSISSVCFTHSLSEQLSFRVKIAAFQLQ